MVSEPGKLPRLDKDYLALTDLGVSSWPSGFAPSAENSSLAGAVEAILVDGAAS